MNNILITEQYLKEFSPIPNNYNWNDILPFIPIAEQIWVVDIIGKKLYDELLEQVADNNVNGTNATLLLKIYPYLAMAILYEALPFINAHISEKGITLNDSENSKSISSSELSNMQNHIRTQLEVLKKMLKEFLNEHAECFPLYTKDECVSCSTSMNDCDAFALFAWNSNTIERDKYIKWYNYFNIIKQQPNSNNRLYSNKGNFFKL